MHVHPAPDAAEHGRALVLAEILPGACPHLPEDISDHLLLAVAQRVGILQRLKRVDRGPVRADALAQLGGREHEIGPAQFEGRTRHARMHRLLGVLDRREAALFLDGAEARGPVAARAREDDAHRLHGGLGQRAKKLIDGRPPMGRLLKVDRCEHRAVHDEGFAWRDDVHLAGLDLGGLGHLTHRQRRGVLQHLGQFARLVGRQMHHHHEGHPGVVGQGPEKALEGLNATGGCAQSDDDRPSRRVR